MSFWDSKNGVLVAGFRSDGFLQRRGSCGKPDGTEMTIGLQRFSEDDRKDVNQKSGKNKTETKERSGVEKRTWTRKNSEPFEAEFVKLEKDDKGRNIVTLRKPDGTEIRAGLARFSEDDRKYIGQHAKPQGSPTGMPSAFRSSTSRISGRSSRQRERPSPCTWLMPATRATPTLRPQPVIARSG